ncbi:hypothetical protein WNY78_14230 [Psychroserpens sp. AS72]|uniref:hypothetical protein n=1 Tax=Psychroserpens sp. AS72 TaxID=3135775 RepID=UPI00318130A0
MSKLLLNLWLQILVCFYINYQIILKALINRIKIIFTLIINGRLKPIFEAISTRLFSTTNFIGLEVIPEQLNSYESMLDMVIRPFEDSDINSLKEEHRHARLVEAKIPNCYVATTIDNSTVYRQWLFKHEQNDEILKYFGPIFPKLKENEAIIEGVFTHVDYRGMRIMPNAMYQILKQEQYKHLKRAIAFVKDRNIGSLKGFYRIGFVPYIVRQEKWFFFKRTVSFIPLPSEIQKDYSQLTSTPSI